MNNQTKTKKPATVKHKARREITPNLRKKTKKFEQANR